MSESAFVTHDEYALREHERREELDLLWAAVREEIPAAMSATVDAAEDRIIGRVDQMDTRVNGRIKRLEQWQTTVNDWWQRQVGVSDFIRGKNWNPIVVGVILSACIALGTLGVQWLVHLNDRTSALCATKQKSLDNAFAKGTLDWTEYNRQVDVLFANNCK